MNSNSTVQRSRFNSFEISIGLREDCLLKAAMVFMVFEVLEKLGEVIKSHPPVELLEGEQFDQQCMITMVTTVVCRCCDL